MTHTNHMGTIQEEENEEEESTKDVSYEWDDFAFIQDQVTCNVYVMAGIQSIWILEDIQLTVDSLANKKLLQKISDAKRPLTLHFNRVNAVTKIGDLTGNQAVQFYKYEVFSNMMSLNYVKKRYCDL